MKRDMDLVRRILLTVEATSERPTGVFSLPDVSDEVVAYHIEIMHGRGLLDAEDWGSNDTVGWYVSGMTWEGQEFLDAIRNDTVWNRVKERFKSEGVGFAIELIMAFAIQEGARRLGVRTE
ncbi:MAG TPA: DUF2513 domain-containing protein [Phycisphaerales bacterium]|nr:DUF2513 domain-containing protein [Phycisphaerales bacterium]